MLLVQTLAFLENLKTENLRTMMKKPKPTIFIVAIAATAITLITLTTRYRIEREQTVVAEKAAQKLKAETEKKENLKAQKLMLAKSLSPLIDTYSEYHKKILAANEFEKDLVFQELKDKICHQSLDFNNWKLKVVGSGVTQYGGHYAYMKFETIEFEKIQVGIEMTNQYGDPLFEEGYNDLSRGSKNYSLISEMKNGDIISASGKMYSCNAGMVDKNWLAVGTFYLRIYLKEFSKVDT